MRFSVRFAAALDGRRESSRHRRPVHRSPYTGIAVRDRRDRTPLLRFRCIALRSVAPADGPGWCFHRRRPACRLSGCPPRSCCSSGDWPLDGEFAPCTLMLHGQSRTSESGFRDFQRPPTALYGQSAPHPAGNPCSAGRPAGRYCHGLHPLSGLRAPAYGCARKGLEHLPSHQPPALWLAAPIRSWALLARSKRDTHGNWLQMPDRSRDPQRRSFVAAGPLPSPALGAY